MNNVFRFVDGKNIYSLKCKWNINVNCFKDFLLYSKLTRRQCMSTFKETIVMKYAFITIWINIVFRTLNMRLTREVNMFKCSWYEIINHVFDIYSKQVISNIIQYYLVKIKVEKNVIT